MTAIRVRYEEMEKVAHARGLAIEPEYATGLAYMYVGRKQYVAELPEPQEAEVPC